MAMIKGVVALTGVGTTAAAFRYRQVLQREAKLPSVPLSIFGNDSGKGTDTNEQTKQRVVIIGAGVVGISTAYMLAKKGHSVAIIEPMPEPGEECSACAAGGMQRSNPVVNKVRKIHDYTVWTESFYQYNSLLLFVHS